MDQPPFDNRSRRQGWPLDLAKEQVGRLTGHCPLNAQHPG